MYWLRREYGFTTDDFDFGRFEHGKSVQNGQPKFFAAHELGKPNVISDTLKAYNLYIEMKITPTQLLMMANNIGHFTDYSSKEGKNRKKDNSIWGINYSRRRNSNRNKIRYPRKCRKTAWKRFYKLFPHLKETQV